MSVDPKDVLSDKDKSQVAELFKLLDNWDKDNSRSQTRQEKGGKATGITMPKGSVN